MGCSSLSFFFRPAIQFFSGRIPEQDLIFEIANEDGVVSQIQQRSSRTKACFAEARPEFQFPAFLNFLFQGNVRLNPLFRSLKIKGFRDQTSQENSSRD